MNSKWLDFVSNIKNKKVAILGLGVSNEPLVECFYNLGCDITIFNEKELDYDNSYNVKMEIGKDCLIKLNGFDYIFRSPSILPTRKELIKAKKEGSIVTTEIEQVIKLTPAKVIGITGSDGKTTTTTLVNEVLTGCGYKTYLGGNIGYPLFTQIKDMTENDIVVLELSSFQLMDMEVSPNYSVITNMSENHLDIHKDMDEYVESKKNIYKYQNEKNLLVVNADNLYTKDLKNKGITKHFSRSKQVFDGYYLDNNYIKRVVDGKENIVLNTKEVFLKGIHNYENICTVLTLLEDMVDISRTIEIIKEFKGVAHRIEFVRTIDGISWYNDSASSTPSRTIAGLYAFDDKVTLICGGYDKNISYEPLAKPIIEKVNTLILFGQTKTKIYEEINKINDEKPEIIIVSSLEEAVDVAKVNTKSGQVVLFSPASASFDMFKNAYQRGDMFKEIVNNL